MAIAFDNATNSQPGMTSWSQSYTTSGTDRILFVDVLIAGGTLTTMTYNGSPMTLLDSSSTFGVTETYYLLNPSSGANTISLVSSGLPILDFNISSYNGCPGGIGSFNKTTTAGSSISNSLTTTTANSWIVGSVMTNTSPQTFTATGSAFIRYDGQSHANIDTNGNVASPSSVTMGASYTFSVDSVIFLREIKSVLSSSSSSPLLMMTPA